MKHRNSLKYQFKKQLAISIGLLVIVFSFLLYQLFFVAVGTTMHRTMMPMASHYAKQVELNQNVQLPRDGAYSVFVGSESIPSKIARLFDIDGMKDFGLSVNDGDQLVKLSRPDAVYFLLVHPIKNSTDKLYLLYNDTPQKGLAGASKRAPLLNVPLSIIFITLLAIFLVYWVARRLISKVLNPLHELSVMAKSLDESNPELSFAVMNDKTEIGEVANTLHQTMGRIHQYHQREKQFLQNASHELRTPIAVVSSALDIIDLRTAQGKTNVADQYTHIRRANKNMAEMTEALLLLSRKSGTPTQLEAVSLEQLATVIIDEHKYLLKGKDVDVELVVDDSPSRELPLSLCRIVLSNLIRNAFEHTLSGIVRVQLSGLIVSITNTSAGLADYEQNATERGVSQGQGFGIGLDIVQKIVAQQEWQLHLSSDNNDGSQVVVYFEPRH